MFTNYTYIYIYTYINLSYHLNIAMFILFFFPYKCKQSHIYLILIVIFFFYLASEFLTRNKIIVIRLFLSIPFGYGTRVADLTVLKFVIFSITVQQYLFFIIRRTCIVPTFSFIHYRFYSQP